MASWGPDPVEDTTPNSCPLVGLKGFRNGMNREPVAAIPHELVGDEMSLPAPVSV